MTTTAVRLEQYEEAFNAYTRGTSDFLHGLKMHECPYPARTLLGDSWELAWGRTQKIMEGAAAQDSAQQLKTKMAAITRCIEAAGYNGLTEKGHLQLIKELRQLLAIA